MPLYKDQLGRTIEVKHRPQKIISLVPSQTELLFDLGLDNEVVGITKFCVHPEKWFRTKERIGGTKSVNIEKIKSLNPDLIIANKEENVEGQVDALAKEFPVWISDIQKLQDALSMITALGEITCMEKKTERMVSAIINAFNEPFTTKTKAIKCCYLIWKDPYMTVGGDTFINDMLHYAGFGNVFKNKTRYPAITIEELKDASPEIILLSSEPFPFKQKHIEELTVLLPGAKILLADGELFSWYGSRLLHAPSYFKELQIQALSVF